MPVRWLKGLLSRERPTPPILLRVVDADGEAPFLLDVSLRWSPSNRCLDRSLRTADGLAVVHWLGEEDEVELTVRSSIGSAVLTVTRAESVGRTIPVELSSAEAWNDDERVVTSASVC
ncbi:MAG: hypothetical protein H6719_35410 [Sandaracinaceae bacterium]|nr:hypothetical protein [Myxococcales bacterium]MCB9598058.1 hypothetical protein [Sandaracinaceae bacterium]